jgi:hypothetical protein
MAVDVPTATGCTTRAILIVLVLFHVKHRRQTAQ